MDQVGRGAAGLGNILAVETERDPRIPPVELGLDPRAQRTGRVEPLGARPHRIELLQVAQRHIVGAGEPQHIVHGPLHRHVLGDPPNHHRHLRLIVHVMRSARHDNRVIRPDDRGGRLHENHHVLGSMGDLRMPGLMHELRMRLIVLGQPVDLRGDDRRQQPDAVSIQRIPLAGRVHARAAERIPVERHQVILLLGLVILHKGILRNIIMRKTCDSHASQSRPCACLT